MDLPERLLRPEPVERLRDGHGVDALIRKRDRLGGAVERVDTGRQQRPHPGDRLDRDDLRAGRGEGTCQLPGTRRQIEEPPARTESEQLPKQRNRRVGILRPRAIVDLRDEAEGMRLRVDPLRHGSTGRGR